MQELQLEATRQAFDSVAADYDGPRGNNALIQQMRTELWSLVDHWVPAPGRLLDLGCGTGLDAARMAAAGHQVTALDWSPRMVERTRQRALQEGHASRIDARCLGAQELAQLETGSGFDAAYSDLGPLNCVPDLAPVAQECARLLRPEGLLVFSVIGRYCPWEIAHYARRRRWARLGVRFARDSVAVGMNGHTIWTRYYTPREFYRPFRAEFRLVQVRSLCLFAPPPYLDGLAQHHPAWHERLWRWDRRIGHWPLLRSLGDSFLMVLQRR